MNVEDRRLLRQLADERGKEYGKLVQKLLACALLDADAQELYERSTQGIDLECELDGRKLSIEVKTCESRKLRLGKKDLQGLEDRARAGREAWLAVLGPGLLDDWRFCRVHPGEVQPLKDILLVELRASRDHELEERLRAPFGRALRTHAGRARSEGQSGLDDVLRDHAQYRRA